MWGTQGQGQTIEKKGGGALRREERGMREKKAD